MKTCARLFGGLNGAKPFQENGVREALSRFTILKMLERHKHWDTGEFLYCICAPQAVKKPV